MPCNDVPMIHLPTALTLTPTPTTLGTPLCRGPLGHTVACTDETLAQHAAFTGS